MQGQQLEVEIRQEKGKGAARRMRGKGLIPAVCYGKGKETVLLKLDPRILKKTLDEGLKMNTILTLDIKGAGAPEKPVNVLIKDYQFDTLKNDLTHTDFYMVDETTPVEVKVPLVLNGTAKGIKMGGFLQPFFFQLPVRCLPQSIPVKIEYEITEMDVGDVRRVSDLTLDEGINVLLDGQQAIAAIISGKVRDAQAESIEGVEGEVVEGEGEETASAGGEGAADQRTSS